MTIAAKAQGRNERLWGKEAVLSRKRGVELPADPVLMHNFALKNQTGPSHFQAISLKPYFEKEVLIAL